MGTLLNCDKHNVAYTHDTTKQSKQSHNPECGMDDGDTLFHLHVLAIGIPNPYSAFVFRMSLVVCIQTTMICFLECFVGFLSG